MDLLVGVVGVGLGRCTGSRTWRQHGQIGLGQELGENAGLGQGMEENVGTEGE